MFRTLLQETFVVDDTYFYVKDISNLDSTENVSISETTDGYYCSTPSTTTENQYVYVMENNGYWRGSLSSSFVVEFDIKPTNVINIVMHTTANGNKTVAQITSGFNNWKHIRIEYDSTTQVCTGYVDNVADTDRQFTVTGTNGLNPRLIDFNKDMDCTIRNIKAYLL